MNRRSLCEICCYLRAQQLLNKTLSGTPSYADRRERDACVLVRKAVFFLLCMQDKAETWQPFPLWESCFGQEMHAHIITGGEDLSQRDFQRLLSCPHPAGVFPDCSERAELPLMCREAGLEHWSNSSTAPAPDWAGERCVSVMRKSLHRELIQKILLELVLHEVCARDLIFQNSSLFQWLRPCLKNVRNVIPLVSFPVAALTLEREKLGSFPHHLTLLSPWASQVRTEQKACKLMNTIFCFGWFFNRV